jgi:hypothetical protein
MRAWGAVQGDRSHTGMGGYSVRQATGTQGAVDNVLDRAGLPFIRFQMPIAGMEPEITAGGATPEQNSDLNWLLGSAMIG